MIDQQVLDRLHWVQATADLDLSRFPDFMIVGPQRTGTTWLHANLRWHPEVFLSEPKEIFFFSRLKIPHKKKYQSNELGWYLDFFRDPLWRKIVRHGQALRFHRALHFPKVRGEATASYAALDLDIIQEIAALNPATKIIMMVRDPVERAWSHAKKDLVRNAGRKIDEVAPEEFQKYFSHPYQIRCARYGENLTNWRRCFPKEQILVGHFDDVATRPRELLVEVMKFLGVSSGPRFIPDLVGETVNPAGPAKMPKHHRSFLQDLLKQEIAEWKAGISVPD